MANPNLPRLLRVLVATGLAGCTLITSTPPTVGVLDVQLTGLGVTEQRVSTTLCLTNPNQNALSFKRVTLALDVSGEPFAAGAADLPVFLPPQSSTAVPFTVVTTVQNLGSQLLGVLRTGGVDYRVHGTVTLQGGLGLVLPFSRSGRIDPLTGSIALADAALDPATSPCLARAR
jgi:LEA14-like dessication related protein